MKKEVFSKLAFNPYISLIIVIKDLIELFISILSQINGTNKMIFDLYDFIPNIITAFFLFVVIQHLNKVYSEIKKNKTENDESRLILDKRIYNFDEAFYIQKNLFEIKTNLFIVRSLNFITFHDPDEKKKFENNALFAHYYSEYVQFRSFLFKHFKEKSIYEIELILSQYYPKDYQDEYNRNNQSIH